MKTRLGFVSNSSTSSFVLYIGNLSSMQVDSIIEYYNELAKDSKIYDDNGEYINHNGTLMIFNANHGSHFMFDYLTDMGIDTDTILDID